MTGPAQSPGRSDAMSDFISRNRILRQQSLLLLLIAAITGVFIWQTAFGWAAYRDWTTVPARVAESWSALRSGTLSSADLRTFGTLLTSAFLHGNIQHLAFNLIYLWVFAALVSELLGQGRMLAIFFVAAIFGSIGHTVLNPTDTVPMLGASGAVMGFMGAYLGLAIRWRLPDPHVWPMARPIPPAHLAALAVAGVVFDLMATLSRADTGVAYGAHLGGFVAGAFVTSVLIRRLPEKADGSP